MDGANDIDTLFSEKIKPFESRIKDLEEAEEAKDQEIDQLKQSIHRLSKILEELKQNKALNLQKWEKASR